MKARDLIEAKFAFEDYEQLCRIAELLLFGANPNNAHIGRESDQVARAKMLLPHHPETVADLVNHITTVYSDMLNTPNRIYGFTRLLAKKMDMSPYRKEYLAPDFYPRLKAAIVLHES